MSGGIVSNVEGTRSISRNTLGKEDLREGLEDRDDLKLPEASGALVTSMENGPITDDAFDRGRVFNYASQERGTAPSMITVNGTSRSVRLPSVFVMLCVRT